MQEWCACGSSVKGWRRDVLSWRLTHTCAPKTEAEPERQGTTAQAEIAYFDPHRDDGWGSRTPQIVAQMGFQPNPAVQATTSTALKGEQHGLANRTTHS